MRINIVGTTGAGKTTLARKLSRELGVADIELDELYWQPKWTTTPPDEFMEKVRHATHATDSWVLHGNYTRTRPLIWARATHIVWLDYPPPFIFFRLLKRTLTRSFTKEPMWSAGNKESFTKAFFTKDSILIWFFKTYKKNRTFVPELLRRPEFSHLKLIHLKSPGETESLLSRLVEEESNRETALA